MPDVTAMLDQLTTGDPATINTILGWISPQIFDNPRLALEYVRLLELREQDLNAQAMPSAMFNALVSNIERSRALESVPLCARRVGSEQTEIVSGHHRIRAALQAGHEWGLVMVYRDVTCDEIAAKQLAHNSIAGESNPEIVQQIFSRIEGLEQQMEAYIDTDALGRVPAPVQFQMVDIDPLAEAKTMTLVFLPVQFDDWSRAVELLDGKEDAVYLAHRDAFDAFKAALHRTRKALDVHSMPTAVAEMARLVIAQLDSHDGEDDDGEADAG
jgi:hypothetical protein